MRPSSSHLTRASSSLTCRTVPNSPVGIPKSPRPSTRSPGLKSRPGPEGSTSGGFFARSESGGAPRCNNGGWGALRSLGVGLLLLRGVSTHFFLRAQICSSLDSSATRLQNGRGESGLADPNCSVLIIDTDGRRLRDVGFGCGQLCRARS